MKNLKNKKINENPETLLTKTRQIIITNPETIEAFKEADYIAKNGGKRYKSFNDVMKDVFENG